MNSMIKNISVKTFIWALILFVSFQAAIYANIVIDRSNATNGLVTIRHTAPPDRDIRIVVDRDGRRATYPLRGAGPHVVPLQFGTGSYTISVVEGVGGGRFRPLQSETFTVNNINEQSMFTASSIMVNFAASTVAMPYYRVLTGPQTGQAKVSTIHRHIIENFDYDFELARSVQAGYIPVIDAVFNARQGICFDYAVLFAGALRDQGVPARLVMGYAPGVDEFHAWNEVLIDGNWVVIDTTVDAQLFAAGRPVTMARNAAQFRVVRFY